MSICFLLEVVMVYLVVDVRRHADNGDIARFPDAYFWPYLRRVYFLKRCDGVIILCSLA